MASLKVSITQLTQLLEENKRKAKEGGTEAGSTADQLSQLFGTATIAPPKGAKEGAEAELAGATQQLVEFLEKQQQGKAAPVQPQQAPAATAQQIAGGAA